MLNKLFNYKFHLRFMINPLIRINSRCIGNYVGVKEEKRDIPIIVSLTSIEERYSDLELTLYSLLNQSVKPDKIILWFSDKYNLTELPYNITRYIKNGLEIRFVPDIGSYTKIIYSLKEFHDCIVVTADDDIYYSKDWLKKLYHSYISNPQDIHVHRAHRVKLNANIGTSNHNIFTPYEKWCKHINEESARYDNFLTGVGGVLYPPNCFNKEVLRKDVFLSKAPNADDIWLWFMALLSNRKIRVVQSHIKTLTCTNIFRQMGWTKDKFLYSKNKNGGNDMQINELEKYYRENIISKLR